MTPEDREWVVDFSGRDTKEFGNSLYFTREQWNRLSVIITDSDDLVFRLEAPLGFELVMYVFEDAPCLGVPPEPLIWVFQKYLPGDINKDQAWDLFTRWTHSPLNIQKLKFYDLPLPRPRGYYEY